MATPASEPSTAAPEIPQCPASRILRQKRISLTHDAVELLTPEHTSHVRLPYQNDSRRADSAVRSVLDRLRLPLIIDGILRTADEAENLSSNIRMALSAFSIPDQRRVRSFAHKLCRTCDALLEADSDEAIKLAGVGCEQSHPKLEGGEEGTRGDVRPRSAAEECDIELNDGEKVPGTQHSQASVTNKLMRSDCQHINGQDPLSTQAEDVEDWHQPVSDVASRANTAGSEDLSGVRVGSDSSDSMKGATLVASSPSVTASVKAMTPEGTPQANAPPRQTADCEQGCMFLINQDIDDFIDDSCEQIRRFSLPGNSAETYKALFGSLENGRCEDATKWSDGSEWMSLVEAGHGERQKGSIRYALTAIAFSRWHASQVQLLHCVPPSTAAREVSGRILGPKPDDDAATKRWERRRKNLGTHLTRGRKWSLLVKELGSGILLKNAWRLAKSPEPELKTLIKQLQETPEKMAVLRLLAEQMTVFIKTGRTDQVQFRAGVDREGLSGPEPGLNNGRLELDTFHKQVRDAANGDKLVVTGTNFRFGVDSLRRLGARRWLNDEIILASLHLSDKLAFVRVGFSIPMHKQSEPQSAIPRPFERAAKQMADWHCQAKATGPLVCFFPLFQHQNHFSLLEVNEIDGYIYHYDSLSQGDNATVRAACAKDFPNLPYIEENALQQDDGHSCGLLTIKHARGRMLGRPVVSGHGGGYDSGALRSDAVRILQSAWTNEAMVAAPESRKRRKVDGEQIFEARQRKKGKLRE